MRFLNKVKHVVGSRSVNVVRSVGSQRRLIRQ